MSKRSAECEDSQHLPSKKQPKLDIRTASPRQSQIAISGALKTLYDNADELIECLTALKRRNPNSANQDSEDDGRLQQQLSIISRKLVPSLSVFSAGDEANSNSFISEALKTQKSRTAREESKQSLTELGLSVPTPAQVVPWSASDIPTNLPEIPKIYDIELESIVFTHPGISDGPNYERLEWLGDAYVELISSILISKKFSHLPSGRWTQLRERIVRNITLAEYFRDYGLEPRAKVPESILKGGSQGRGRSSDKDIVKTQADMFEAYVAAAIISDPQNGLTNTIKWLRGVWSRTLEKDIRQVERLQTNRTTPAAEFHEPQARKQEQHPKQEVSNRIMVPGVFIRYEKMECSKRDKNLGLPLFSVGLYLDGWGEKGKLLGIGTALSVKEAGAKAAQDALNNKKLLGALEAKKRAYLEAREAANEDSHK